MVAYLIASEPVVLDGIVTPCLTESDWVRYYAATCPECASYAPSRWYALCPQHAPVARNAIDATYEAMLVRQKFFAIDALAWMEHQLDCLERIERGLQWIAEDPDRRTERGMRRITELRAQIDPLVADWSVVCARDVRDELATRVAWYEQRLAFLATEQRAYAGAHYPS